MNKLELLSTVKRGLGTLSLGFKRNSPAIFLAAGVVGIVGSTVLACKATLKIDDVLAAPREGLEKINDYVDEHGYTENYTKRDVTEDKIKCYGKAIVGMAKIYSPAILLGGLSLASILTSHKIMSKRNFALATAYTALSDTFKKYRDNTKERFGEDIDKELLHGVKERVVEKPVVDENGEVVGTKKEVVKATGYEDISDFAKFFDEACHDWSEDPNRNLIYLKAQQNHANEILKARGHLFLNEVYEMLDIPITDEGQVVGWIYDPSDPTRDNYVDFGIYESKRVGNREFVNGHDNVVLLDFNVDGVILNKFKKPDARIQRF